MSTLTSTIISSSHSSLRPNLPTDVLDYARLPIRQPTNAAENLRGPPLRCDGELSPLQTVVKEAVAAVGLSHYHLEKHMKTDPTGVKAAMYFHLVDEHPVSCGMTGVNAASRHAFFTEKRHQKFHAAFKMLNRKAYTRTYVRVCVRRPVARRGGVRGEKRRRPR
jgi:hypothetical protein